MNFPELSCDAGSLLDDDLPKNNSRHREQLDPGEKPSFDFTPIIPHPGFCVKFLTDEGDKVFVNVCHHDSIPPPREVSEEEMAAMMRMDVINMMMPVSISEVHYEADHSLNPCPVYDIATNSSFFCKKLTDSEVFKEFFLSVVLTSLEQKFDIKCDPNAKCKIMKKMKQKGQLLVHRIQKRDRKKLPSEIIEEIDNKGNIQNASNEFKMVTSDFFFSDLGDKSRVTSTKIEMPEKLSVSQLISETKQSLEKNNQCEYIIERCPLIKAETEQKFIKFAKNCKTDDLIERNMNKIEDFSNGFVNLETTEKMMNSNKNREIDNWENIGGRKEVSNELVIFSEAAASDLCLKTFIPVEHSLSDRPLMSNEISKIFFYDRNPSAFTIFLKLNASRADEIIISIVERSISVTLSENDFKWEFTLPVVTDSDKSKFYFSSETRFLTLLLPLSNYNQLPGFLSNIEGLKSDDVSDIPPGKLFFSLKLIECPQASLSGKSLYEFYLSIKAESKKDLAVSFNEPNVVSLRFKHTDPFLKIMLPTRIDVQLSHSFYIPAHSKLVARLHATVP